MRAFFTYIAPIVILLLVSFYACPEIWTGLTDPNISMLSVFRVCLGLSAKANTNSLKRAAFFCKMLSPSLSSYQADAEKARHGHHSSSHSRRVCISWCCCLSPALSLLILFLFLVLFLCSSNLSSTGIKWWHSVGSECGKL